LILGDPGARDAMIHGLQACIPQQTLLPIAVEQIVITGKKTTTPRLMLASGWFYTAAEKP
jgi:enediyne polyketide synthase